MPHLHYGWYFLSLGCTKAHYRAPDNFIDVLFSAILVASLIISRLKHNAIFLAGLGSTPLIPMLNWGLCAPLAAVKFLYLKTDAQAFKTQLVIWFHALFISSPEF